MAVTLKDIAERVGKSVTTVSRALNDYDDVGPETKVRIRQVANELGYSPSSVAQRLQKNKSDTLGLILPTFGSRFSDPFFSELLAGIGAVSSENGYDLLVSTHPPGERELLAYHQGIKSRRVDGYLIVRTRKHDTRISFLQEQEIPFVAYGRTMGVLDYPFVDEDSQTGMKLVAGHLAGLGHTNIAVIAPPESLTFTHYRLAGLIEGLTEAGIQLEERNQRHGDLTQRGGFEQAKDLLTQPNPPTAIVACNDLMAMGAISAAQELGLLVGTELSITGFDNIPMAEHTHPPLTTLHQPIYEIGGLITEKLIQLINQEDIEVDQVILMPDLIVRKSTGPAFKPLRR